ncbi:MAG: rhodanese-like domain-containing protein [Candidatus Cryptobacteroides sp.]
MKRIVIMGILSSILGLMGCNAQTAQFKTVDAKEFAEVIADTSIVVLDVRTAEEFQAGHIKGALNIDVMKGDFVKKASSEIPEGKTVALYCRSGNRSKKAANALASKYKVIELGTGYIGWTKEFGTR